MAGEGSDIAREHPQQATKPPRPFIGRAPAASFIVCTRNRARALTACIRSIEAASRAHGSMTSELIVVDNGSTDDTAERLAHIVATSSIAITPVVERRRGLAAARNEGMERSRGRILIFIDDDCEVDLHYLRDLERHYASGERLVIRGGRVELGNARDLPFTIKRSREPARFTPDVHPGGFILGCNMTMHREVAQRVGRFDERFGAGSALQSAEDTDYLVRAFKLGIPIEYVPDMNVLHYHGRNTREAIERLHRNYSLGNGGLCLKHLLSAPWLLRHFYWSFRSAWRELWGGPRFDPEVSLSHWPIVYMNLLGAFEFVRCAMTNRPQQPELNQIKQATRSLR
ncbi:glycosyltransferase family 2 protein [Rhizobium sp. P40RR-XXII]|uniref:glycosyltransferase family 2 protein n=1 Tax=Rhizobium sp. P40RR-XXII TaxID=2726739 RepID=UPI0014573EFB|nr:glycosyltransferase family 2 protein [Rhizobium sp. P40RR-XXII]NLS17790.1 glycosyltransferase family 2 protein [Rhizobium sp. P40RR-XXII]